MPKFSQISERFQKLKSYWEELGGSSSRSGNNNTDGNFGSTHRLAGGSLRKYSHPNSRERDKAAGHLVASTECISGQYGDTEGPPQRAAGSKGVRASTRGTVKQGIRKRFEAFEELSTNGLDSRKGSISEETKAERAEIFLRFQAEKLQDRNKFKSVFYDRIGPEMADPAALSPGAQQASDEEDVATENGNSSTSAESAGGGRSAGRKQPERRARRPSAGLIGASAAAAAGDDATSLGGELAGRLTGSGPSRTLWCNMREVLESGLLSTMSKEEVKLQEAQFEIITSEASYYKNILVLIEVFYNSPMFDHTRPNSLVKALDKHHLFSNIVDIFECSTGFLRALEDEWNKSPRMDWISRVILDHLEGLKVYKDYCRNFYYQTKTLQKLRAIPEFVAQLGELERHPDCRRIPMQSFLEMPMKRVMSLQLLMDAVMRRMPTSSPTYSVGQQTLGQLLSLARECDQESRMMSEKEQLLKLQNQMSFNKVKKVGFWGGGRHLIREGQVRVLTATPNTQGFVSKLSLKKNYLQLHAFSDLLIVSKPKGDQEFQVLKHCPRAYVDAEYLSPTGASSNGGGGIHISNSNGSLSTAGTLSSSPQKQSLRLSLVDNSDGSPEVILLLEMKSREEAERWMLIFRPRDELGDPVYEQDDCPQAEVMRPYKAQQKDDMSLLPGDIVNIYKKTEDGWFLGSRLNDLSFRGWFPGSHVKEVENEHYKAKLRKVSFRRKTAIATVSRHKT